MASSSNVATFIVMHHSSCFRNKICPHQAHNRIEFTSASTWTLVILFLHEPIHHLPHYLASSEFPCSLFAAKTPSDNSGVDDVKQKLSDYIWQHVHLDIRTSDFVILCNPSLATRHRWTPGLLKLNYTSTWYEVLHQLDLPLNTPTLLLETCTTSQWQWMQDHQLSFDTKIDPPRLYPRTVRIRE